VRMKLRLQVLDDVIARHGPQLNRQTAMGKRKIVLLSADCADG